MKVYKDFNLLVKLLIKRDDVVFKSVHMRVYACVHCAHTCLLLRARGLGGLVRGRVKDRGRDEHGGGPAAGQASAEPLVLNVVHPS